MERTQRRPHVQGKGSALKIGMTGEQLTDGAGLLALRETWDKLRLGEFLDRKLSEVGGDYRPSLLVEQWTALLPYGGSCMDDLPLLASRGVQALYGWEAVPHPTSFGRFLRRGGEKAAKAVEEALRRVVRARWAAEGRVPRAVMLNFDSTVSVRYGKKQAGAEVGYNPKKRGRTSHHPMLAFLDTGDCMGVRWRPGNANCAAGTEEWVEEVVGWLRAQGVKRILVRLDKGYFKEAVIRKLLELGVDFVLKMQEAKPLQKFKGPFRPYAEDPRLEVSSEGRRWGARLLCVRQREKAPEGELPLGEVVIKQQATIITNLEDVDPVSAWRMYNQGAVVEHRIEEMGQLGVGRTAVDDIGGNHLLWSMGALAYQLTHFVRTCALEKKTREQAQVKTLRALVFRIPGKLVWHARRLQLKLMEHDPMTRTLLGAINRIRSLRLPPLLAA